MKQVIYILLLFTSYPTLAQHGNVKTLVQDFPDLALVTQQYKRVDSFMKLVGTDSLLLADSLMAPSLFAGIQQALTHYGDCNNIMAFFDAYPGSPQLLQQTSSAAVLLSIVFNAAPDSFLAAFGTAFGDSAIDNAIASSSRMSMEGMTAAAYAMLDVTMGSDPGVMQIPVLKEQDFSLAEHDFYGSARLGIKNYYPRQVGFHWDVTNGYADTIRLWNPMPWYSLQYQDVIKTDSLNLYGNTHNDFFYAQHILGLKQYELTDHLGDVMATVSDKRAVATYKPGYSTTVGAPDTIDSRQPVVVTAYDYYPFGQYMPTRYTEDTSTYCFTTTRTEMVTVVTWVPEPFGTDLGNGGVTTLGGGVVFEAGDAIGIELRSTTAGDGFSFMISGQIPNLPAELHVSLERVLIPPGQGDSGAAPQPLLGDIYNVMITDDSSGELLGSMILDPGQSLVTDFTVPFAAKGGLASVSIVALGATPGDVNIHVGVPVYSYVPHSIVSTVCNEENYRYEYNGQMKVNEIAGKGNHYTALYWEYDPRAGRRWNLDPEPSVSLSEYSSLANSPIQLSDPLGNTPCCETASQILQVKATWQQLTIQAGGGPMDPVSDAVAVVEEVVFDFAAAGAALYDLWREHVDAAPHAPPASPRAAAPPATVPKSVAPPAKPIVQKADSKDVEQQAGAKTQKGTANPKVKEAIKIGNKAHTDFKEKADKKGWTTNPRLRDPKTGKTVIPDAVTNSGKPVELKPNTPTGTAKGASQLPQYERATGNKGRVITYDPKKY